jgi:hypothetical protein
VDGLFNGLVGLSGLVGGFAKGMLSALIGFVDLIRGLADWAYILLKGLATLDGTELRTKGKQLLEGIAGIPGALSAYFQQWSARYAEADDTEQARMIGELTGEVLAILATSGTSAAKLVKGSWKLAEKIAITGEKGLKKATKALPKPAMFPGLQPAYATPVGPPPSVGALEGTTSFSKKIASKTGGTSGTTKPKKGAPTAKARATGKNGTQANSPKLGLEDAGRLGANEESIAGKLTERENKPEQQLMQDMPPQEAFGQNGLDSGSESIRTPRGQPQPQIPKGQPGGGRFAGTPFNVSEHAKGSTISEGAESIATKVSSTSHQTRGLNAESPRASALGYQTFRAGFKIFDGGKTVGDKLRLWSLKTYNPSGKSVDRIVSDLKKKINAEFFRPLKSDNVRLLGNEFNRTKPKIDGLDSAFEMPSTLLDHSKVELHLDIGLVGKANPQTKEAMKKLSEWFGKIAPDNARPLSHYYGVKE